MKLLFLFLIVCVSIPVPAQKKISYKGLSEISGEVLNSKISHDIILASIGRYNGFKNRDSALTDLDHWLNNYNPDSTYDEEKAQYKLLKKNYKEIKDILYYTSLVTSNLAYYNIPLLLGLTKNNPTLLYHSLVSKSIYNTLKMDSRERAKDQLNSIIYPSLKTFVSYLGQTDIKYFGVSVAYFSKDFANDKDYEIKVEALVLIAPIKTISDFINGKITDTDFLDLSDIYLLERGGNFPVKIKL
ncbi:hypothetical protein [Clostridium sp.]|uniref:hypothetical protein n=1 Tax=Clostridium sp. TaxID=1506 RepID=UPI00284C6714|nr:hypothetical protein [Clostridium sp.]MDR3598510.1 hypothetical protein [Clostridium sp.]